MSLPQSGDLARTDQPAFDTGGRKKVGVRDRVTERLSKDLASRREWRWGRRFT